MSDSGGVWLTVLVTAACVVIAVVVAPFTLAILAMREAESWWRVRFGVDLPLRGGNGWTTRCALMRGYDYLDHHVGCDYGGDPWLIGRIRWEAEQHD